MKVFDDDPARRWLFCLTHPDDEISICAWIRRLTKNGNEVFMSWTHSNDVREREGRAAALVLGVPQRNLYFFGAQDGQACDHIPQLLPEFEKMMLAVRPDRVACGAFEQGHIDHDTTNFLVNHSFDGPVLEIPFYHTYLTRFQTLNRFSQGRGQEIIELDRDERRLKTMVARQYPSQNIWSVLLWYEIWQRARLRPIELTRTERMRVQTHHAFDRPSHPAPLARRVQRSPHWHRWVRALAAVRASGVLNETERTARLG